MRDLSRDGRDEWNGEKKIEGVFKPVFSKSDCGII